MSTPWWVTVLVAVLSASGAVASQLLNGRRADRRYERERADESRRYRREQQDRAHQAQRDRYARTLAAVAAARAAPADAGTDLAELRLAAADLEFSAPEPVLAAVAELVAAVERWLRLRRTQPESAPAVVEAYRQLVDGLTAARAAMRTDLDGAAARSAAEAVPGR